MISYNTGPRYNGTPLYIVVINLFLCHRQTPMIEVCQGGKWERTMSKGSFINSKINVMLYRPYCEIKDIFRVNLCFKGAEYTFFHNQLWFPASDHDFRRFDRDFRCFCKVIAGNQMDEEIQLIMDVHVELSSPSWVCILQKSLAVACDFWNTNSLRWTPFRTDAHDGFSISPSHDLWKLINYSQMSYFEVWGPDLWRHNSKIL